MDVQVLAQLAHRARYLSERVGADAHGAGVGPEKAPQAWRREAFRDEESFHRYLEAHGTTEGRIAEVLAGRGPAPVSEPPAWALELGRVIEGGMGELGDPDQEEAVVLGVPCRPAPFSTLISRFTGPAVARLRRTLRDTADLPERGSRLEHDLRSSLSTRLLSLALRTLVTELHLARERGELRGDGPEARYEDFNRRLLASPDRLARLFSAYPVLGRLLVEAQEGWRRHVEELFTRLSADRPALAAQGWIASPHTPLTSLKMDAGDAHDGGRTVAICTFACGGRVVYKPREVRLDVLYERAVGHLNGRAGRAVARAPPAPWPEHAMAGSSTSSTGTVPPDRLAEYYRNLGATLALTYVLGAGDVHMENAVSSGEHSVVIDLETLLQNREVTGRETTAFARARDLLNDGVLGVGFLPMRVATGQGGASADASVVAGGLEGAEASLPVLTGIGTDSLAVGRGSGTMRPAANLPGEPERLAPASRTEDIVAGFTEAYGLLARDRDGFLSALGDLSELRTRHLLRPTRLYSRLLYESTHPVYLRDGIDREHLFDRLWATTTGQPSTRTGTASEIRQLLRYDVPRFTASVTELSLWEGDGPVDDFYFTTSAAAALRERLARPEKSESVRHAATIREAMSALSADRNTTAPRRPITLNPDRSAPDRLKEQALSAAGSVLEELAASRIDGAAGRDCTWIGLNPAAFNGSDFEYRPLSPLLFEGAAGMAVAYVGAAKALGTPGAPDPGMLDIAWRCARPVTAFVADTGAGASPPANAVGAYSGYAGALYALLHLSAATGGDALLDRLLRSGPETVARLAEQDSYHDLAAGAAGAAVVCLRIYEHTGDGRALETACRVAHAVVGRGLAEGETLSWPTDIDGGHLGGFAHGASGIGWALLEVGSGSGDDALLDAGSRALAFDTARFDAGARAWPDLRREVRGQALYPVQWCHGAIGIGMSRALTCDRVPSPDSAAEAEAAVEALVERGLPPNDSLCHGTLGAREFLSLMAGRSERARGALHRLDRTILRRFEEGVAQDGIVGPHTATPGLLLGRAGFVLGLLRMAEPERVPSVLSLEGPGKD
ncbi:type 2 lanthipeptide synthetase LanM family protein [Nocardiopsis composta]